MQHPCFYLTTLAYKRSRLNSRAGRFEKSAICGFLQLHGCRPTVLKEMTTYWSFHLPRITRTPNIGWRWLLHPEEDTKLTHIFLDKLELDGWCGECHQTTFTFQNTLWYPFSSGSTREHRPIEFNHLYLWIGKYDYRSTRVICQLTLYRGWCMYICM